MLLDSDNLTVIQRNITEWKSQDFRKADWNECLRMLTITERGPHEENQEAWERRIKCSNIWTDKRHQ